MMGTTISYFCLGGAALFLYKSITTLGAVVHMYYRTAKDVHDIRERLARLEEKLTPLATAAEQMAKEEAQIHTKDDESTKSDRSEHGKLDDDWWCLFSRPDTAAKKRN
jgi:hypothetical protein